MDVIFVFLNYEGLIEIIYMDQLDEYVVEGNKYLMCLLTKGLIYGLKQSQHINKELILPIVPNLNTSTEAEYYGVQS